MNQYVKNLEHESSRKIKFSQLLHENNHDTPENAIWQFVFVFRRRR